MILKAAQFASRAHKNQLRRNGTMYINHPARVAAQMAIRDDATDRTVAAAFLHDVLEDTSVSKTVLAREFGFSIADLVEELTNRSKVQAPKASRATRKRMDCERLAGISREAKIIKMLDRLDNLSDLKLGTSFANLYLEESLALAEAVGDADEGLKKKLVRLVQKLKL